MCMIEMLGMCGIRQPSYLSLVASLMGKCSLVTPLSHGSPLQPGLPGVLLAQHYCSGHLIGRHVIHIVPVSVPSGKCHAETSGVLPSLLQPGFPGVLLAQCYSPESLADDRHVRCDSCMPVSIGLCRFGFTTSHVGPGSLSYGC